MLCSVPTQLSKIKTFIKNKSPIQYRISFLQLLYFREPIDLYNRNLKHSPSKPQTSSTNLFQRRRDDIKTESRTIISGDERNPETRLPLINDGQNVNDSKQVTGCLTYWLVQCNLTHKLCNIWRWLFLRTDCLRWDKWGDITSEMFPENGFVLGIDVVWQTSTLLLYILGLLVIPRETSDKTFKAHFTKFTL